MKKVKISNYLVGEGEPCFIIAEAGINHNGDFKIAKNLVDEAKNAGADAIKFQTFHTDKFLSKNIIVPKHIKADSIFDLLRSLELSESDYKKLAEHARKRGIIFMSTPLDYEAVDLLDGLKVPLFKVASCDLDALPLLKYIASKKKPIVLSTGMGTLNEVGEALEAIRSRGNNNIVLLHCVSVYPPKAEEVNLRAMETMRSAFQMPVGYSDHTMGINVALAAVALGANAIEKHFTLDRKMEGPDQALSADPGDLKNLVSGIREIEKSLGTGVKVPSKDEISMKRAFRRSIVAAIDIEKGQVITEGMIIMKRPGIGISPKHYDFVVGRIAKKNINEDSLLTFKDFY